LTEYLPLTTFRRCVARYDGEHKIKRFTCLEQFLCLAFAQLTYRESLRDIEACLHAHREKLYHMGIRSRISRSTLADANEVRDWRIYADFAQRLIGMARQLYANDSFANTDSAASPGGRAWDQVDWPIVHRRVRGLQIRIAKATRDRVPAP
jgi:Domain of unknown function (DUF4372)